MTKLCSFHGVSIDLDSAKLTTVIAYHTEVQGDLYSREASAIFGQIGGSFYAYDGVSIIAPEGIVYGNVRCNEIIIGGEVHGNVVCTGTLSLLSTARIFGNITYGHLQTQPNATVRGRLEELRNE